MLGSTPVMPLPTEVKVAALAWPLLGRDSYKPVGNREGGYDAESAGAKLKLVAVLVQAKRGLPPLRARHVGRAEWQRPGVVLTFAAMVRTMF